MVYGTLITFVTNILIIDFEQKIVRDWNMKMIGPFVNGHIESKYFCS